MTTNRSVIVLEPGEIEIPSGIDDLAAFRNWIHSPEFPESGRFDWLRGRLEVDVALEDLETHGSPKATIAGKLVALFQETRLGRVYIDRARLTCPGTDLSVEPDVLVVLVESVECGRCRLVPRKSQEPGRFVEIEGRVDLVVECVSDGSVRKDVLRLRELYHRASIPEYWIVDARSESPRLEVLIHEAQGYRESPLSVDGFRRSGLLGAGVRLVREAEQAGLVFFRLDIQPDSRGPAQE